MQAAWRARNPDYFRAVRLQCRDGDHAAVEPPKLPPPLSKLPWNIAQDEFGVQGADFLGALGRLLLEWIPRQPNGFRNYPIDSS
jgi:hypothetical protein